jgi:hypothetical protein
LESGGDCGREGSRWSTAKVIVVERGCGKAGLVAGLGSWWGAGAAREIADREGISVGIGGAATRRRRWGWGRMGGSAARAVVDLEGSRAGSGGG